MPPTAPSKQTTVGEGGESMLATDGDRTCGAIWQPHSMDSCARCLPAAAAAVAVGEVTPSVHVAVAAEGACGVMAARYTRGRLLRERSHAHGRRARLAVP